MKRFAQVFGAAFLLVGIAGFIPALCPDGKLLGLFAVDTVHNVVHIATGLVTLAVSAMSEVALRNWFRVFGIVYGLVAVLGLFAGDKPILGIMANNMPDVVLHFLAAALALYCGFARSSPPRGPNLTPA